MVARWPRLATRWRREETGCGSWRDWQAFAWPRPSGWWRATCARILRPGPSDSPSDVTRAHSIWLDAINPKKAKRGRRYHGTHTLDKGRRRADGQAASAARA